MMGQRTRGQERLFYEFCLDEVVPADHVVRRIDAVLDTSWVHQELAPFYSTLGRPSVDPELMIRMLIVGYVFADPPRLNWSILNPPPPLLRFFDATAVETG